MRAGRACQVREHAGDEDQDRREEQRGAQPGVERVVRGVGHLLMSLPCARPCPADRAWPLPPVRPPVSIVLITIAWKVSGMCRCVQLAVRLDRSCAFTSAPRIATPVTAPISRLVFVADAAMPERSGGTADSADGGDRHHRRADADAGQGQRRGQRQRTTGCGLSVSVVSSSPALNSRQPTKIDQRGPAVAVQRPASTEARIISTVIGRKTSGDLVAGVADHLLQVQRGEEEHRERREVGAERDHVRGQEPRDAQEPQVEQRMGGAAAPTRRTRAAATALTHSSAITTRRGEAGRSRRSITAKASAVRSPRRRAPSR